MKPIYFAFAALLVVFVVGAYFLRTSLVTAITRDTTPVVEVTTSRHTALVRAAVVAAVDPDFWSNPISHSSITLAVVRMNADAPLNGAAEIRAAFAMAEQKDRNAVLDSYLDSADYGRGCIGLDAAARGIFEKSAAELSDAEVLALASLSTDPVVFADSLDQLSAHMDIIKSKMLEVSGADETETGAFQSVHTGEIALLGGC